VQVQQMITLTMTEQEARDFCLEVWELLSLLAAGPDQGNTRTGMARIREIRDQLAARGLDEIQQQSQAAPPPNPTGPVVQAVQGYQQPYPGPQ
jgi:hypothetical protein